MVASNATWVWKDVKPDPKYATGTACPGAIYLFNERARHYIPIYSIESIGQVA